MAAALVDAVRHADAVLIATPGYHGGMSGLVKNALDHLEALRVDERPYLDGRAGGVIVSAAGWQAAGTALVSVRATIHALRGWPTPFGVTVNSAEQRPDGEGHFDERVDGALRHPRRPAGRVRALAVAARELGAAEAVQAAGASRPRRRCSMIRQRSST